MILLYCFPLSQRNNDFVVIFQTQNQIGSIMSKYTMLSWFCYLFLLEKYRWNRDYVVAMSTMESRFCWRQICEIKKGTSEELGKEREKSWARLGGEGGWLKRREVGEGKKRKKEKVERRKGKEKRDECQERGGERRRRGGVLKWGEKKSFQNVVGQKLIW